jgi:hypothetical protein
MSKTGFAQRTVSGVGLARALAFGLTCLPDDIDRPVVSLRALHSISPLC